MRLNFQYAKMNAPMIYLIIIQGLREKSGLDIDIWDLFLKQPLDNS